MKKLLIPLIVFACVIASANDRTETQMRAIASSHFGTKKIAAGMKHKPGQVSVYKVVDEDVLTVYAPVDDDGFIIVARDDRYPAVLAHAEGSFDAETLPADVRWWLNSVRRQLKSGLTPRRQTPTFQPVENFITTRWGQGMPYNRKTPSEMPVGCAATAMAQAMNYWKYPSSVQFEEKYYVITDSVRQFTGKVNSTYNWGDFKDSYSGPRQGSDVAQLLADCGIATSMQYSSRSSGTYTFMVARALTYYYCYPEASVKTLSRAFTNDELFYQIIYDELQAKMPVLFAGVDNNFGGHAFVLSGINDEGLVYVNWGWNGTYNGFYAIDLMNSPEGYFDEQQEIVYGIRPNALPTDHVEGRIMMLSGEPYTFKYEPISYPSEGIYYEKCIQINLPNGIINQNGTDMRGVFGLFATDLTDGSEWVVAETDRDTIPCASGYFGDDLMFFYDVADLKANHTYRMSFGVKDDHDTQWRSLLCHGGGIAYDVTINEDDQATISEAVYIDDADAILVPQASYQSSNDGLTRVYDATGRLVYSAPSTRFNLWDVPAHGILVVKEGNKVMKIVR